MECLAGESSIAGGLLYMPIGIPSDTLPAGPLRIAALEGCKEFAVAVDKDLVEIRRNSPLAKLEQSLPIKGFIEDSYLIECHCPRYGTGEGKGIINDSVRGADLYILVDVLNSSITYSVFGEENHMSPDNHYENLKRIISAANGKAKRITGWSVRSSIMILTAIPSSKYALMQAIFFRTIRAAVWKQTRNGSTAIPTQLKLFSEHGSEHRHTTKAITKRQSLSSAKCPGTTNRFSGRIWIILTSISIQTL
jgi:hypothetical protein